MTESVDRALEGNVLDRIILLGLMVAGAIVLLGRRREVRTILRANGPFLMFFAYCAVSVVWSDYPGAAFKRWTKAVGDLIMVLIVLTDPDPRGAVKHLLARVGFVLLPASVLLIKYYPALGLVFSQAGDRVRYTGVTLDKNMLGALCLIVGLGCVWRLIEAFGLRKDLRKPRPLIAQVVLLALVFWLFAKADSMTALACFALAGGVLAVTSFPALSRNRWVVHLLVVAVLSFAFATLFLSVGGEALVAEMGRDATLTGRTELWQELLSINQNPLLGAGFESFWLGERLEQIWALHWWRPNEAHNGYLEVFLNLGWTGVALLTLVAVSGYRNVIHVLGRDPNMGRLRLALFVAVVAYGLTEAAFRVFNPVWILFIMAILAVPQADASDVRSATPSRFRHASWTRSPNHVPVNTWKNVFIGSKTPRDSPGMVIAHIGSPGRTSNGSNCLGRTSNGSNCPGLWGC